jgi:hypothetical protein
MISGASGHRVAASRTRRSSKSDYATSTRNGSVAPGSTMSQAIERAITTRWISLVPS